MMKQYKVTISMRKDSCIFDGYIHMEEAESLSKVLALVVSKYSLPDDVVGLEIEEV